MRIGSLFTGYGGLDMAAESIFGAETVWTSDVDPGACKIIAARYPDAPNLGDITAIDWAAVEPVDILTGGWPCQPFSLAGKRKGAADDRALWPYVAAAVRALRPRHVVLENVSAIATAGTGPELARATASLAALGYVGSWLRLRASEVGAPHRRERIFILAANTRGEAGGERPGLRPDEPQGLGRGRPGDGDGEAALLPTPDATHGRKTSRTGPLLAGAVELLPTPTATPYGNNQSPSPGAAIRPSLDSLAPLLPTPTATDSKASGGGKPFDVTLTDATVRRADRFGQYADAITRWTPIVGRPAPDPTINGRLSPAFVEWMMGLPAGWVTDVPDLTRAQQLRALGNGVVPQQAIAALDHMTRTAVAA